MKYILITVLIALNTTVYGQTSLYNGREIPLHIDSVQTNYNWVDSLPNWIVEWYVVKNDTFGKCYQYFTPERQQLQQTSLVRYRASKRGLLYDWTNWEYFGKSTYYYKNGGIMAEVILENEKRNGLYNFFYQNGQLSKTGTYRHDKPTGQWKFYNDDGRLKRTKQY